jgi:hypothetical protein
MVAIVDLEKNPTITDTVRFRLLTPDYNGCFLTMPYKFDSITIYFVERDFSSGNTSAYNEKSYDPKKIALAEELEATACANPTSDNIAAAKRARALAEQTVASSFFYFNQANPIKIVGKNTEPAWITGHEITGISATNPVVITSASHGLNTGDTVYIYATNSAPPVDGEYEITYLTSNTFSIDFDLSDPSYTAGTDGMWFTSLENSNNFVQPVVVNNQTTIGLFEYLWEPRGVREGDYFICWKWTPLVGGDSISSHIKFSLSGNTHVTTSIPTHFTNPEKYKTLLEKYTPEMFKTLISDVDETPSVIDRFNQSVALGFTTLENLANQIVDLQDPNVIAEPLLPYLSNLFNLKLKSNDPTRWRGQIARAIPLFKNKGTRNALEESFGHAGMKLVSYKPLWQVVSRYTWQESFTYEGIIYAWELGKVLIEPIDLNNFYLWIRPYNADAYTILTSSYVSFSTVDGITTMTWVGDTLSVDPITLISGDTIRVLYQYSTIPSPVEQDLENYVRTLELIDKRDERSQIYPLKNWNVRGIEQDDVLFNLIVPSRNPFHDFLIFGQIRTEFPYSENIYNMEEYNGSIRNSKVPCDIGREFVDPCSSCISSSYNIDVQIDALSNDRINEFYEVLAENMPFHALLNTVNFYGGLQEFIASPQETIECLVKVAQLQYCISGEGQTYFNRSMRLSNLNDLPNSQCIFRNELATKTQVVTSATATAYNSDIVVYCPSQPLAGFAIRGDHSAILQILDGAYQGSYIVYGVDDRIVYFNTSPTEPIDGCNNIFSWSGSLSTCSFPFRIINPIIDNYNYGSLCNIIQDNLVVFGDSSKDFGLLGIKSQFDVNQGTALSAYEISIPAYGLTNYTILNVDPSGNLTIDYDSTLPSSSSTNISYTIYNGATPVTTGTLGFLTVTTRGRVTVLNSSLLPISSMITGPNFYHNVSSIDYEISSLVDGTTDQFYISGYNGGTIAGLNMVITKRMVDNVIGYMSHRGMNIQFSGIDYETSLGIQDGSNNILPYVDPVVNNFMANYIIEVDGVNYWMSGINGNSPAGDTTINLSGPDIYWRTLLNGGTSVTVNMYKYNSLGSTIPGQQSGQPTHTFQKLDRSGSPNVTGTNELNDAIVASLSVEDQGMPKENIKQKESISYKIVYSNGSGEEGTL